MRKIDFKISRILSSILIILLLVSVIPISTYANTVSGTCGENATWKFDENTGTLTISGTGDMAYYSLAKDVPWYNHITDMTTAIIEDGITSICRYCFTSSKNLNNVIIPDSVTIIYNQAFSGCTNLKNIYFPNNLSRIENSAFSGCSNLENIQIPYGVTNIGYQAFYNCRKLTAVVMPDSVTSLGEDCFYWCESLQSITLSNNLASIPDRAFMYNRFENITIPNSVESLGNNCFTNSALLKEVIIPESVTTISNNAFTNCNNIRAITVDKNNKYFCDIDGILYNKDVTELIKYPPAKTDDTYTTPDTLETLESGSLQNATSLITVNISKSVSKINNAFDFSLIIPLKYINVDENNNYYSSKDGILFNKEKTELILCARGNPLSEYKIPNSVVTICESAFYNTKIANIDIPNSVEKIDYGAFRSSNLTELIIPDSVITIAATAFYGCSKLSNITFGNGLQEIGHNCFTSCDALTKIVIPANVTKLGHWSFYCKSLTSFTILNPSCIIDDDSATIGNSVKICGLYNSTAQSYAEKYNRTFIPICLDGTENHSLKSTTTATCTEDGIMTYTCADCGYTYDENDTAKGHSFTDYTSNNDATCTNDGTKTAECDNSCGETEIISDENSATGHNYSETIIKPTCTEQGYTTYTCVNCNDSYNAEFIDATGHSFDDNEQYCLNNCGEINPDYVDSPNEEESTTVPALNKPITKETTEPITEEITVKTEPPSTTKAETITVSINNEKTELFKEKNQYSDKTQTDYSAFRIVSGFNQIKVAWEKDKDLDGYEIYISTSNNGDFEQIADIKGNNEQYYLIDNLHSGKMYYVKIVGYVIYNDEQIKMNESRTRAIIVK